MTQIHPPARFIGYARVSTEGQDLSYQIDRLEKAGCVEIFHEKRSGKNTDDRPELHRLLAALQKGDTLFATVSDRVARDPLDMLLILHAVRKAGATLHLLDEAFVDTSSEMDDLITYLNGWAARQHRLRILYNTAVGRERAKQRGVKFGRPRKLGPQERKKIVELRAQGETCGRIARAFGVSESTIIRTL
ncbi:recombinase family protein [Agrobacterium tumefaciens]|uniref:recombinase family protein n=1 Tax=Agrobacterium tumefaciens TaxID=358 RepID=UPI001574B5CD|nr:recombinase family protein [Agrobacterium tumefaciens]NTD88363.1 recombinase family protein [Agrobacterium tumefaciens]NTD91092.1 recombinase family protein [Agrobacterium tumefaciens]NTD98538.1 recombinase family protein [Agrobacterium tumefaciens]NTE11920.1 recombinase family protein [Agrobacterium tumefaciens]NTE19996.1 recombinase family protein [Agrobacterium tumefaciens]